MIGSYGVMTECGAAARNSACGLFRWDCMLKILGSSHVIRSSDVLLADAFRCWKYWLLGQGNRGLFIWIIMFVRVGVFCSLIQQIGQPVQLCRSWWHLWTCEFFSYSYFGRHHLFPPFDDAAEAIWDCASVSIVRLLSKWWSYVRIRS